MKTLQTLCIVTVALLAATVPVLGVTLLEDDFESYTSGTVLTTAGIWDSVTFGNSNGSYSWGRQLSVRDVSATYPGDGSRSIPASPFGTGTQVLEFWDVASPGRDLLARATLPAIQAGDYPMTVSFDYRLDDVSTDFNGQWRMTIAQPGVAAGGYFIDLVRPDNQVGYINTTNSLQAVATLDRGVWYHMEFTFTPPSGSANQPASLSMWSWADGDASSTFVGTFGITGRQGVTQYSTISFADNGPNGRGHWYMDNFKVSDAFVQQTDVIPEPASLGVLGLLAGVAALRRRFGR